MLTKKQKSGLLVRFEKHRAAIAKERDGLRALVDEAEEIIECCEEAERSLDDALDALSKYL